jgi:DNA (cytosine-5)-methyltransferase 1
LFRCHPCASTRGGQQRLDAESETLIPTIGGGFDGPVAMRESGQGYWMQDDIAGTLRAEGEDRPSRPSHVIGTPIQPISLQDVTSREKAQNGRGWNDDGAAYTVDTHATQGVAVAFTQNSRSEVRQIGGDGQVVGALAAEPGAQQQTYVAVPDVAGTMKACKDSGGWSNSADHAAAGYMVPVAFHPTQDPITSTDVCHAIGTGNGQGCATAAVAVQAIPIDTMNHVGRGDNHSFGDFEPGAPSYTLTKGHSHAVAAVFVQDDTTPKVGDDLANCLRRDAGGEGACVLPPVSMQVRRLTPVECERLQGFPDGYTAIPWRKKPADECPDGPRYKALGNSWAVPVVRWIGRRIAAATSSHASSSRTS